MINFTYHNPVKIVFGKGMIAKLAHLVPAGSKVMLAYGGGSIKKNGVYEQVCAALQGFEVVEFGGIEANPRYATCMEAAAKIKAAGVNFILAVGGGSVLDGAKFIAVAARFEDGDPWQVMEGKVPVTAALPLGCVLTLPATGSEMNCVSVVSRDDTGEKLAFSSGHVFPLFSILDPETTFSLPLRQVKNGIVDPFVHVMEQYVCRADNTPLQARQAEAILLTLLEEGPKVLADPENYAVRANLMWCATAALNNLLGCGVEAQDWSTHMIGHELTILYGLDHAQTLAVIMPLLYQHQIQRKQGRLAQCAERIWGVTTGTQREKAEQAIQKMKEFFEAVGVSTSLTSYGVNVEEAATKAAANLAKRGAKLGEYGDIGAEEVAAIIRSAQ
ncbi:MAG: iron-containing alcohol dehydrogenase [Kiritimatiellae bacterium]|nr:iron-containing alcohol dehydrogenase [Kiritimatiellia bacterium]